MTDTTTTRRPSAASDGIWGTLGWTYPGFGLSILVGLALAGPSAALGWAPWEFLGRMMFGVSMVLAVGGGLLALCIGWVLERRRRSEPTRAPQDEKAEPADEREIPDPLAAYLGGVAKNRIVLWVLIGAACFAMGVLGEVAPRSTNRIDVGTRTGEAVPYAVWVLVMVAVALAVVGLVVQCLSEDRVRRTRQRPWLREQLSQATTPPAAATLRFYRGAGTPHASRACALLAAPLVCAGIAVLVIGSFEIGGVFTGSTGVYAGHRLWGVAAILAGLLLLALGSVRATRWHRENADLRTDLLRRWP